MRLRGLTPKQARSVAQATAVAPQINLWHGAVRSGKTIGSLLAFLIAVAEAPSTGEIVVLGRTRDTINRNLMAPLKDAALFGEITEHVRYNPGAATATVLGRTVHLIGTSDVRSEAVIRGLTVCLAYVDEVSLLGSDTFSMLVSRCSVDGAKILGTTNPDGPQHWLKVDYLDRADELGHRVFHFTLPDNAANLPDGFIDGLMAQYQGLWRKRFIDGEWSLAAGVIYEAWNPAVHVVAHDHLPPLDRLLCLGVDYGTTNPTVGVLLGLTTDRRLVVVDEWHPTPGTDGHLTADLVAWLAAGGYDPEKLFIDPAAASFKMQLRTDGLGPVFNGANRVTDGIRLVASLLASRRLLVSDRCTTLIREIPGYVWDAKATEKGHDAPIKRDDHACDALRYAVATARPMWLPYLPDLREALALPDDTLEVAA